MQVCAECGRVITVFIGDSSGLDWKFRPFCDACRQRIPTGAACPGCSTTFADFLDSGLLGCATCYTAHAGRLRPLLAGLHVAPAGSARSTTWMPPTIDSLARSRTAELNALLNDQETRLDPALVPGIRMEGEGRFRSPPARLQTIEPVQEGIQTVRLRMARNLNGLPFSRQPEFKSRLAAVLLAPGSVLAGRRVGAGEGTPAARTTFIVGDEDHLRCEWIFPFQSGPDLVKCIQEIESEIAAIDRLYLWQSHRDFGHLTACPANSGSGLRLSFRLAIPRLLAGGRWSEWRRELEQSGLMVRGPRGEGSQPSLAEGIVEISNRHWPPGLSPGQESARIFTILARLVGVLPERD